MPAFIYNTATRETGKLTSAMTVFLEALAGRGRKDPAASVKSEKTKYKALLIVPSPDSV